MQLEFGGKKIESDVRRLFDMREVIFDQNWLAGAEDVELYYMYRDLYLSRADKEKLVQQGLRYDITIIPPNRLGREYIKTAGHYHPLHMKNIRKTGWDDYPHPSFNPFFTKYPA